MNSASLQPEDRLAYLVDRYLDAALTADEAAELNTALLAAPTARDRFVQLLTTDRTLAEAHPPPARTAPARPASAARPLSAAGVPMYRKGYEPQPFKLRANHIALAAAALIAACGLAAYLLTTSVDPNPNPVDPNQPGPSVATLIHNSGNLRTPNGFTAEGDSYGRGEYTLSSGTAEFMLTNAVNVKLRGNTRMHMRNNMNVTLSQGSAEFVVPKDAKGFTVHLPDHSRIVDLGTRFSAQVIDGGHTFVRTLEGRIKLYPAHGDAVVNTQGQAAIIDGNGRLRLLSSVTYDFSRLDVAEFPGARLADQDGWVAVSGSHPATVRGEAWPTDSKWAFMPKMKGHASVQRVNDEKFGFAIANGSLLVVEYELRLGHKGRGARLGIINDDGNRLFSFGNNVSAGQPSAWTFVDRLGKASHSDQRMPQSADAFYHLFAIIDLAAYDGDGSFSLAAAPIGEMPEPIENLQDIPMNLGDTDGSDMHGLALNLFNAGGVGPIHIHHVPAPVAPGESDKETSTPLLKGSEK